MKNEKRLIDANALIDSLEKWLSDAEVLCNAHVYNAIEDCICEVDTHPTVDAVEVVHGYWIDSYSVDHMGRITEHSIDCSVCDSVFKDDSRAVVKHWKEQFKVCPFCGAKMDGDGNG